MQPPVTETPLKMTYEDFLAWADEDTHAEWVNGEVIVKSPISNRNQKISGFLLALIQHYVEIHDLGTVMFEPFQMKIAPDLPGRSPDIMFISKERSKHLKNIFLDGLPIWRWKSSVRRAGRGIAAINFMSTSRAAYGNTG